MKTILGPALFVLSLASAAVAQDEVAGVWTVEGTVGVVSDYRYRGYTLSDEEPAFQAGATLSHASGFYADAYLSTIAEYGMGDDGDGAEIEITLSAGWAGSWAGLDWDAAVSAYRYPDGSDVNYVEIPVQASRTFDATTATLGVAYTPAQSALADHDSGYVWIGLDHAPEAWPISLSGSVGYEEGAWYPDGKTDWRAGAFAPLGPVVAGLEWVDSDQDEGAVVASLFAII